MKCVTSKITGTNSRITNKNKQLNHTTKNVFCVCVTIRTDNRDRLWSRCCSQFQFRCHDVVIKFKCRNGNEKIHFRLKNDDYVNRNFSFSPLCARSRYKLNVAKKKKKFLLCVHTLKFWVLGAKSAPICMSELATFSYWRHTNRQPLYVFA